MTQADYMKIGIGLAICFAGFKFGKSPTIKTASVAVGAMIVAKRVPYLKEAI